jgi:hypothetical protein
MSAKTLVTKQWALYEFLQQAHDINKCSSTGKGSQKFSTKVEKARYASPSYLNLFRILKLEIFNIAACGVENMCVQF